MVGKDASATGQVLLAHNNDLSGNEASKLLKNPANEKINILPDSSVSFHQSYEMLVLQTKIGFLENRSNEFALKAMRFASYMIDFLENKNNTRHKLR